MVLPGTKPRWSARLALLLAASVAFVCNADDAADDATARASAVEAAIGAIFEKHGVEGALCIESLAGDVRYAWRPAVCDEPLLPASTFKILHSLIALETGVLASVDEVLAWDGTDRGWQEWNKDHCMRSAIRVSAVWFYQEVARRVGEERMRAFLEQARYGNGKTGKAIDRFWLDGELRASARQQVDFLRRLQREELPFRPQHQRAVKDILVVERGDDHVLRAKSGWAVAVEPNTGWYVGTIECRDEVWLFATYVAIRARDQQQARARAAITREVLTHLGLLPGAR